MPQQVRQLYRMRGKASFLLAFVAVCTGESEEDTRESDDRVIEFGVSNVTTKYSHTSNHQDEPDDSSERIGATVTQVYRHPYAASLLKNNSYVCSSIILNTYWALTVSKCFDSNIIASYVTHKYLGNYTLRAGSSYNHKGGSIFKIKMLINNFDLKVSAVKMQSPLEFGSRIQAIRLPAQDDDVTLGYLAAVIAWMPSGHMRVVNTPVIDPSICEPNTKLLPGHYICVGGVQDPNRHFCRRDNGGAVIQNNTLVAISNFLHKCAVYTTTHAFPKVSSFARWLDSTVWDENNRPTTTVPTTRLSTSATFNATTETVPDYMDPSKFMLTLPYDPVNVPLEPAEDNSVIPRMSMYESYLQNMARSKTSTTRDPNAIEEEKRMWLRKFGKAVMMMPPEYYRSKLRNGFDYQ